MKIKTSITLSEDLLATVDQLAGPSRNRSEFIEMALRSFISQMVRQAQNAKDIEIINRYADELNAEAIDVLTYQIIP